MKKWLFVVLMLFIGTANAGGGVVPEYPSWLFLVAAVTFTILLFAISMLVCGMIEYRDNGGSH